MDYVNYINNYLYLPVQVNIKEERLCVKDTRLWKGERKKAILENTNAKKARKRCVRREDGEDS